MHWLERHWHRRTAISVALLPLAWLYCLLAALRRMLYRARVLRQTRLPVAVIVVGNLTVGGTGKTPLVIWLARYLRANGRRPGIVTRGYGGRARRWPQTVSADSDPAEVGDEAVLLARRAGCPVVAGPVRTADAQPLLAQGCDVVVSDDGLQHYALARDIEIAVIDGERRFGNGFCLPAGPLREPLARLETVALRVTNGKPAPGELGMELIETGLQPLGGGALQPASAFAGKSIHAVAGIGHPQRFFTHLARLGMRPIAHAFPDHYRFQAADIAFHDDLPVIMTEKDAVKCERFAGEHHWYLAVEAQPDAGLGERVLTLLKERRSG